MIGKYELKSFYFNEYTSVENKEEILIMFLNKHDLYETEQQKELVSKFLLDDSYENFKTLIGEL